MSLSEGNLFRIEVVILLLILILGGCSRSKENPAAFKAHPDQWMDQASDYFHGKKAKVYGLKYCGSCHGSDYRGGTSGISCFTCHWGSSSRPGWSDSNSADFHGKNIKNIRWDLAGCQRDHETDWSDPLCVNRP